MRGGYHSARDHQGDLTLSCDVVVVGSGAGGAVVATELAESGWDVVVLEEGPLVPPDRYGAMRVSESLRHVWRDGAATVAVGVGGSPTINVTMGRCVGGSSVLTGGVCFRLPDRVLETWTREHGLEGYTPAEMEPYFERVEEAIHVEEVPVSMRSRSTTLFDAGARAQGWQLEPMRRNTRGCDGCGRCNFGCPHGAKQSVDISYLPRAVRAGAQVFSHCRASRVLRHGGRAVGVEGRLLNRRGGRAGGRLTVHARRVVIACSAWFTPVLLGRSGVGARSGVLGRRMTVHPGFKIMARFDEPVRGWKGALQSAFSEAFEKDGITLTSVFIPVSAIAATLPGVGPELARRARQIENIAVFGGMLHDEGGGTVRRGPGGGPFVTYRMSAADRARIPKIIRVMSETYMAAGAKEIFPPIIGLPGQSPDSMRALDLERFPARRIECTSQHPLGTARMGSAPDRSVVDGDGRAWDLDELYVADGSVLPTSLGVNPQLSIMGVATRIAQRMRERPLPRR